MAVAVSWSGKPPIRYGIRAARPSSPAASKAAAIRAVPVSVVVPSGIERGELRRDLVHVLIAAAAECQHVEALATAVLEKPGDRVGRLERRDDALETSEIPEGAQGLHVGGRVVRRSAGVAQIGVLGADPRIVEARRDRMRLQNLAVGVLEDSREGAVQDALAAGHQ